MTKTAILGAINPNAPMEFGPRPPKALESPDDKSFPGVFGFHPGDALTVKRVVTIFRSAEYGFPVDQCDLFEDVIENDGHLRGLVETRTDTVAGKEWIIQAGGDDPEDHKAAEMLADALAVIEDMPE